ncbi:DNA mismatch repair protein MutT, partial [Arthrobacter stackebrandtii]
MCASERLHRPYRELARSHRYCAALNSCGAPVGAGKPAKRPPQT